MIVNRLFHGGVAAGLVLAFGPPAWAGQLPLSSVNYFNPYQDPASWSVGGTAIYQGNGASVRNSNGAVPVTNWAGVPALLLDAVNPPGAYWNVYFKVSGNPLNWLRVGTNPAVHLRLQWSALPTNGAWDMNVQIDSAEVALSAYLTPSTNVWQDIYIPASAFVAVEPALDLSRVWDIALLAKGNYSDHCTLGIGALDLVPSAAQLTYTDYIKIDQAGYEPMMPSKLALVSWLPGTVTNAPSSFEIVAASNNQVVLTGALTPFVQSTVWPAPDWTNDGDVIYQADFGALTTPGTYRVVVPQLSAASPSFVISSNAYQSLFRDSLRFFYYSRAGVAITHPWAENFTRAAVHAESTNASYNYDPTLGHFNFGTNTTRDVHGCWFDAGDTHMDVADTSVACWFLLEIARDFGANIPPFSLDLPESYGGQSDLVPLIWNAIDWLERMQNADGSVCHYVMGNPNTATQPQEVSDISSFATACAAAVFAKTWLVLGNTLAPADADALLARAALAWSWLQANTNMVQPRLPLVNGVDPGGDDPSWGNAQFDSACRAFAAVELFNATGQGQYNDYFTAQFNENGGTPLAGPLFGTNTTGYGSDDVMQYLNNQLNFAFMDYARSTNAVNAVVQSILQNAFLHQANVLTNYVNLSGYRIPMLYPGHLYWGSSGGVLAPAAMVLARAFQWTGDTNYHYAAMQALHFICGRNPVNRMFLSGHSDYLHGTDFYSQFWTNLLQQPPGYLGANINVSGSAQPVVQYPWKRFINTQDADMTEPGVYWNSAFAWLAGYAVNDALPPPMQITLAPPVFALWWPLRSLWFQLETSTNLGAATAWTSVTNQPTLTSGAWKLVLPLPATGNGQFYRLLQQ
jgi:endoglucanase